MRKDWLWLFRPADLHARNTKNNMHYGGARVINGQPVTGVKETPQSRLEVCCGGLTDTELVWVGELTQSSGTNRPSSHM